MKAAQHGFSKKVKKLTDELEECHCDLSMYEERRDGHEGKLRELREELEQIDTEIAALRPQVDLDTLEGRCKPVCVCVCVCVYMCVCVCVYVCVCQLYVI